MHEDLFFLPTCCFYIFIYIYIFLFIYISIWNYVLHIYIYMPDFKERMKIILWRSSKMSLTSSPAQKKISFLIDDFLRNGNPIFRLFCDVQPGWRGHFGWSCAQI